MDKSEEWLANLKRDRRPAPPSAKPEPTVDSFFSDLCKVDDRVAIPTTQLYDGDGDVEVADALQKIVQQAADSMLAKNCGVADAGWNEPLTRTSAKERFEKACERIFAGHTEEYEEALGIGRRAVTEERAAMIASTAA